MNNALEHRLVRRLVASDAVRIIVVMAFLIFWSLLLTLKPTYLFAFFTFPVLTSSVRDLFVSIRDICRFVSHDVEYGEELTFKISKGHMVGRYHFPQSGWPRCFVFFESNRNLINGKVILRQVTRQ